MGIEVLAEISGCCGQAAARRW